MEEPHPPKGISIINHTSFPCRARLWKREISRMLDLLSSHYQKDYRSINIALVGREDIRKLNTKYLGKDDYTDTLSFLDVEDPIDGDVCLCPEIIVEDAVEDNREIGLYLAEVTLHSLLHLFGLEHDYTSLGLEEVYKLHRFFLSSITINGSSFYEKSVS